MQQARQKWSKIRKVHADTQTAVLIQKQGRRRRLIPAVKLFYLHNRNARER